MRVPLFCLALAIAAFVALPETKGAPTPHHSGSVESVKIAKEKRSERAAQEEKHEAESESSCSNGLKSGTKSLSESKQHSLSDEEKSHSVVEKKTATGTQKVEHSVKKKKTVTVSEKKTVLLYYLVSYKKLPKKKSKETRVQYYQRIFPKEQDLNVFYRKIFKAYENETPAVYMERVEFILNHVYPELDCRLDLEWLEQFDHYYTIKYSRKVDECDASYYPRVLARLTGESCEHYKQRMACLVEALDEEDFTHITFDDSENGFTIGVKKTADKKTTSAASGARVSSQISASSKKSKVEAESEAASETSVSQSTNDRSSGSCQKTLKKTKELEETDEEVKCQAYRVAYTKLPKKCPGESDLDYYQNFFGKYDYKTISEETRNELYLRILIQYKGETCADYVKRVDYLFDTVYPELDARTHVELISMLEHYYKEKCARKSSETEEQWFTRVLTRWSGETSEHYKLRVLCLQDTFEEVEWTKVIIDENSTTGYRLAKTAENTEVKEEKVKSKNVVKSVSDEDDSDEDDDSAEKKSCARKKKAKKQTCKCKRAKKACGCKKAAAKKTQTKECSQKTLTKEDIKSKYSKIEGEDIITYYKRIVTKSSKTVTSEEYAKTITSIRKEYPDLDLWCDIKYLDYVKEYYTTLYQKKSSETEETYYKRIVTKESYETDECFAKRLEVVHRLYPTLALWSSEKYYPLTKNYYETYYKKSTTEDETTYYSRITTKLEKESDEDYINRITLVRRTYHTLPVWYSKEYLSITKSYYTAKYTKLSSEKEETYYKRIVTKECYETDEEWAKRMEVVREVFPNLTLWSDDKFYDSCTKKYIEIVYKRSQSEDETSYYSRLLQKCEKESTTEYYNRITLIKRTYSKLPIWYSKSYLSVTKQYYTAKYTKLSTEKDEVYYKRIVTREVGETDEVWAQRVEIVHGLYPSLSLWYDSQYYETYTKQVYSSVYKKSSSEDVTTYYTRICSRFDQESDTAYAKRLSLIMQTYSNLDLWYSNKYTSIVKEYYSLTYTKLAEETDEAYVARLLRKECVDTSDEIYAKRVHLVHTLTASSSVWSKSCYYEKYLSAYYSTYYARVSGVSCDAWLTTVLTPLAGECEDAAVARVTLIKRAVSGDCDCWTEDVLTKVTSTSCFSSEYISKIRSACFTSSVTTSSSSSSSSSSVASSSTSESEEVTMVSRD